MKKPNKFTKFVFAFRKLWHQIAKTGVVINGGVLTSLRKTIESSISETYSGMITTLTDAKSKKGKASPSDTIVVMRSQYDNLKNLEKELNNVKLITAKLNANTSLFSKKDCKNRIIYEYANAKQRVDRLGNIIDLADSIKGFKSISDWLSEEKKKYTALAEKLSNEMEQINSEAILVPSYYNFAA